MNLFYIKTSSLNFNLKQIHLVMHLEMILYIMAF